MELHRGWYLVRIALSVQDISSCCCERWLGRLDAPRDTIHSQVQPKWDRFYSRRITRQWSATWRDSRLEVAFWCHSFGSLSGGCIGSRHAAHFCVGYPAFSAMRPLWIVRRGLCPSRPLMPTHHSASLAGLPTWTRRPRLCLCCWQRRSLRCQRPCRGGLPL